MKLEVGDKFKSSKSGLDCTFEITEVNYISSKIKAIIKVNTNRIMTREFEYSDFEKGECVIISEVNKKCVRGNKNDQLEDDGVYAD